MKYDVCIVGGAGHVGLPLGVAFANARVRTALFDINRPSLEKIRSGIFPFKEKNGDAELKRALKKGTLAVSDSPAVISRSKFIVLVVGTPVDEYLNPSMSNIMRVIEKYFAHFRNGQILILRSTVYPGVSEQIQRYFLEHNKKVHVAFCPERIAQGRALTELTTLPQIVSAFDSKTLKDVSLLFRKLVRKSIIPLQPIEAELAKLFSNSWRYIKFAVANQFFMIAEDHDLDYHKIHEAMLEGYPRNKDLPRPGFAAGPCLLKDTMQLAAFHNNNFFVGHSAMLVNEGLPNYIIQKLRRKLSTPVANPATQGKPIVKLASANPLDDLVFRMRSHKDLKTKTIGILGMAFKADSDDHRDSLAYKLRRVAETECRKVLCTDVYIKDPSFVPLARVLDESDILILAAPHREYRKIRPAKYPDKHFVDIWNFWPKKNLDPTWKRKS